jgi:prepilin-type N-terminal cleavage/methylation domain-containing protein/prepilin-type processing-associated H-X9-DG protein
MAVGDGVEGQASKVEGRRSKVERRQACFRRSTFDVRRLDPQRPAFTILELLVVIGLIALLAALAVPAYQRTVEAGRATACSSHLRQLGVALNTYLGENEMKMPILKAGREKLTDDVPVIDNTLDKYVTEKAIFACPADPRWAAASGTSYHWNVALNGQPVASLNFLRVIQNRSRIPVLGDKEGFHPYLDTKVNILYADGHASKDVNFVTGN